MTSPNIWQPIRATASVISNSGVLTLPFVAPLVTASGSDAALDAIWANQIRPLLLPHCLDCHSTETQGAGLDIEHFEGSEQVRGDIEPCDAVLDLLKSFKMAPQGRPQLCLEDYYLVNTWIHALLKQEAKLRSGAPRPELIRHPNHWELATRLSNLFLSSMTDEELTPVSAPG